ncbi:acetyltransferase [Yaniella flava]|uniref:Acetyltransferase n=1 Tax=Yaniella flava TaxID=287930 RepID=A0ABP5GG03_9MICC
MSVEVVVIGAGGFGRETLDVIEAHNSDVRAQSKFEHLIDVIGVADDLPSPQNLQRLEDRDYTYLGTVDEVVAKTSPMRFILAIGAPKIKDLVDNKLLSVGWRALTVVHPAATVGTRCVLGEGSVICSGAQISTNARFGRHVHVNPNATIGHDTILEDYVSVNPGAVISGEVIVQRRTLVGAASVILQGLKIGHSGIIGASACVVKDMDPMATVVGVPARPLPRQLGEVSNRSNKYEEAN